MRKSWAAAGAFVVAAIVSAQPTESPLARLEVSAKKVGWDGVDLGMSVVQTERRVGQTLVLDPTASGRCGKYKVDVERNTLRLTLGFSGLRPGAKIETIWVRFEGYQVLATRADLVDELKRRAPGAQYLPDPKYPDVPEAERAEPSYSIPAGGGTDVRLNPGGGLLLALSGCLE